MANKLAKAFVKTRLGKKIRLAIKKHHGDYSVANKSKCKFDLFLNGKGHKIIIEEGDCLEILEKLQEPYDLIFMDAGKGHYNHFLPHCLRLLKDDGIIIADNVLFRGMVASDELVKRRKITIVKRMRTYLELVSQDKDLVTSVIPMGDGIAITKRKLLP